MTHSHQFYPEQQIEFLGKILCRASCFDLIWHYFYASQFEFYAILSLKFDHVKRIFLKIWIAGFKGKFLENYCKHCFNTLHSCSWIRFIGFSNAWQHLTFENATNYYCHWRHCHFMLLNLLWLGAIKKPFNANEIIEKREKKKRIAYASEIWNMKLKVKALI